MCDILYQYIESNNKTYADTVTYLVLDSFREAAPLFGSSYP